MASAVFIVFPFHSLYGSAGPEEFEETIDILHTSSRIVGFDASGNRHHELRQGLVSELAGKGSRRWAALGAERRPAPSSRSSPRGRTPRRRGLPGYRRPPRDEQASSSSGPTWCEPPPRLGLNATCARRGHQTVKDGARFRVAACLLRVRHLGGSNCAALSTLARLAHTRCTGSALTCTAATSHEDPSQGESPSSSEIIRLPEQPHRYLHSIIQGSVSQSACSRDRPLASL